MVMETVKAVGVLHLELLECQVSTVSAATASLIFLRILYD